MCVSQQRHKDSDNEERVSTASGMASDRAWEPRRRLLRLTWIWNHRSKNRVCTQRVLPCHEGRHNQSQGNQNWGTDIVTYNRPKYLRKPQHDKTFTAYHLLYFITVLYISGLSYVQLHLSLGQKILQPGHLDARIWPLYLFYFDVQTALAAFVSWGRQLKKRSWTFLGKKCIRWPGWRIFWPLNDLAPLLRLRRHCTASKRTIIHKTRNAYMHTGSLPSRLTLKSPHIKQSQSWYWVNQDAILSVISLHNDNLSGESTQGK